VLFFELPLVYIYYITLLKLQRVTVTDLEDTA